MPRKESPYLKDGRTGKLIKRAPIQAIAVSGLAKAWAYEGARSLDVYVDIGHAVVTFSFPRAALADWIERTK